MYIIFYKTLLYNLLGDFVNNLKKYIKPIIGLAIFLLIYLLVLSLTHYLGLFKLASIGTINFVIMAIASFMGGVLRGKKTSKKGYLEGLKLGGILSLVLLLINIIFFRHFDLYVVMYYLILVVSAVIGSMIGINMHH